MARRAANKTYKAPQVTMNENGFDKFEGLEGHLGEALADILNLDNWQEGDDLSQVYDRLDREIRESVELEERVGRQIRQRVLPLIQSRKNAPPGAGLYRVSRKELEWVHHNVLFNGATVAADGTVSAHDTLLVTAAQIGICTVSYIGQSGEFRKQLFRKDLSINYDNPVEEMVALLEERQTRSAYDRDDPRDELNNMVKRGLMEFAERGLLLRVAQGKWMMGHGNPLPVEMLLGTSTLPLIESSLPLFYRMVEEHKKFVYVPSAPRERLILTLGNALLPLQFMVVDTLYEPMQNWISNARYTTDLGKRMRRLVEEIGPQIVRGVYRASESSPPCVFYAHVEHAQEAALIAMADSVLQEQRGFPMLLSLADALCRVSFEPEGFRQMVQQSYARAGQPFRYLTERETRR